MNDRLHEKIPYVMLLYVCISPKKIIKKVYSIQYYVITFVSDLRQVGGFL